MYLFVKKAYSAGKENTDSLVNRSLAELKKDTSRRPETLPAGEVLRTDRGKPYFPEGGVIFSVSHSGDLWVCLMKETDEDRPLGVDLQQIRKSRYEDLSDRYFSREEKAFIEEADTQEEKQQRFFTLWTEKEACGKALGTGIGRDLLAENVRSRCAERSLALKMLHIADGYLCACCMPEKWVGEDIDIREL